MTTITTSLSNSDKLNILNQHLRNIEFAIYGMELDILVENAATTPSPDTLEAITGRLNSLVSKREVLLEEAEPLTE